LVFRLYVFTPKGRCYPEIFRALPGKERPAKHAGQGAVGFYIVHSTKSVIALPGKWDSFLKQNHHILYYCC